MKPLDFIKFHVWVNNKYKGTIEALSHSLAVRYALDDYGSKAEIEVYRADVDVNYKVSETGTAETSVGNKKWNVHTGEGKHGITTGGPRWKGHIVTPEKKRFTG